jgi:hypothetical protein
MNILIISLIFTISSSEGLQTKILNPVNLHDSKGNGTPKDLHDTSSSIVLGSKILPPINFPDDEDVSADDVYDLHRGTSNSNSTSLLEGEVGSCGSYKGANFNFGYVIAREWYGSNCHRRRSFWTTGGFRECLNACRGDVCYYWNYYIHCDGQFVCDLFYGDCHLMHSDYRNAGVEFCSGC